MGHFIPITTSLVFGGCRGFLLVGACAFNLRAEVFETTDVLKKNFALFYPLFDLQVFTQIVSV